MLYFCVTMKVLNLVIKLLKLGSIFKSKAFMQNLQRGFTLVELVVVVVVLGVISAVAVPKYVDYKEGAGAAAVKGVAAALSAAAESNYSASVAGMPNTVSVTDCDAFPGMLTGGMPAGYKIDTGSKSTGAANTTAATDTKSANGGSNPGTINAAGSGYCTVSNTGFAATATFPFTATPTGKPVPAPAPAPASGA